MKLALIAASIAATANSQAPKLGATCQTGTDGVEKLVIEIPYPDERTAKLLSLEAGDCDVNNYGGSMTWAAGVATLLIPIDDCAMRDELYGTPVVAKRSYGLYRPTATVTFGHKMDDLDVVFRSLPIAAECGMKTSYTVKFDYNNVTSADTEGCTIVNGVCVFPAYGDDAKFEIKEYTDDNFNVEVDNDTRARYAGNPIHLSMQVTGLADEAKFAITECKIVDGDKELVLLNPGAESNPSCGINEIGLSAKYELSNGKFVFNFQHTLFLLRKTQQEDTSTFSLQCTVEICEKTDASSKCNQAVIPCMETAAETKAYFCTGFDCTGAGQGACEIVDNLINGNFKTLPQCAVPPSVTCNSLVNPPDTSRTHDAVMLDDLPGQGHNQGMINSGKGWSPSDPFDPIPWSVSVGYRPWMVMDLGSEMSIGGMAIQGRHASNQWSKSYKLQYWMEGETVADAKDVDGGIVFNVPLPYEGRAHGYNSIHFASRLTGRYFKIIIQSWANYPSMRAGLLGC